MTRRGYIKVPRDFFADDEWWREKRPLSKWEAWIDMIQLAQHAPRDYSTTKFGTIRLERGEFVLSQRAMADRWRWGRQSVRSFVGSPQFSTRIKTQRETGAGTVYLIREYDTYQGVPVEANPPNNPESNQRVTQDQPTTNPRTSIKAFKHVKKEGPALRKYSDELHLWACRHGLGQPRTIEGDREILSRIVDRGVQLPDDFEVVLAEIRAGRGSRRIGQGTNDFQQSADQKRFYEDLLQLYTAVAA